MRAQIRCNIVKPVIHIVFTCEMIILPHPASFSLMPIRPAGAREDILILSTITSVASAIHDIIRRRDMHEFCFHIEHICGNHSMLKETIGTQEKLSLLRDAKRSASVHNDTPKHKEDIFA
jgi:hypothetical protein